METTLLLTINKVRETLIKERGDDIERYVSQFVDLAPDRQIALVETGSPVNLFSISNAYRSEGLDVLVNIKRLNDVQYINKYLEAANQVLAPGGIIVCCLETKEKRKERILNKYPIPLNWIHYTLDFAVKRVIPKVAFLKKIYFRLTRGHNRVLSKMEAYGRIYSCGFEIIHSRNFNNLRYLVAQKVGDPAYNTKATYGPLIRLRRVGKGGKIFPVYKLRTMHPFAEYLQPYIAKKYGLQEGGKFRNDPRVTTLGKFFRKFWLDELPMLFNLIKGDMKLVGFRPLSAHYLSMYPRPVQERRKKYKPGLLPPFYADMPKTFEEIVASEVRYLDAYDKGGLLTDIRYFFKIFHNILIKRARSK